MFQYRNKKHRIEGSLYSFPSGRFMAPNTEGKFQNRKQICPNFMTLGVGYSGLIIGRFEGNI
jgi:hypothetical protein